MKKVKYEGDLWDLIKKMSVNYTSNDGELFRIFNCFPEPIGENELLLHSFDDLSFDNQKKLRKWRDELIPLQKEKYIHFVTVVIGDKDIYFSFRSETKVPRLSEIKINIPRYQKEPTIFSFEVKNISTCLAE